MKKALFSLLLLAGCATHSAAPSQNADAVVAAERAFAANAGERGWIAAFRTYAARDATQLSPDPVNAQESLSHQEGDGGKNLAWGPVFAGIARSGDFGFTTGPYWSTTRDGVLGHYFTVWRKQPDGGWKWIFDGGTSVTATERAPATGPVVSAAASAGHETLGRLAITEVRNLDAQVATGNALAKDALIQRLADDAHVNRPGSPSAIGRDAATALLQQSRDLGYGNVLMAEASSAGDMAFTLGEAHWTNVNGDARRGYYARIWQRRADGWRIVFDELVIRPQT